MSTTVDQRVVEMRFDNKNFESNVDETMSTLQRLKQSLNLTGASKGLENINSAAKHVNLSGLSGAVETVRSRFSALEVMGVTTLANITNSAVNTGKRIVSALTIDPIKTGFQEYETQINAVQTILANTESKGTTIDDVNTALDELNTYADKTIYNFTEMTRNIGTFTAAGVDLDTSVSAIQGIANLAAVSGSTSQQASTAMYQLSQALASGTVKLQDWNSVVNAGMGGEVFQNALKRTATVMGTDVDALIKKYGSFRESLTEGNWLTTDVLTETLNQFTMAAEEGSKQWQEYKKSLMDKGYTEEQATEILKMANTATDAATKVKTFTQLWDTLKESVQSGWTQSWEIVIGDFEEAKEMLTDVSDAFGKIIGESADARNKVLRGWKAVGGRDDLLVGFKNIFEGIGTIVKPIKEAFAEIFPSSTGKQINQLKAFTDGFRDLTAKLKISSDTADKIKSIFKGVFSIFDIGRKVVMSFADAITKLLGSDGVSSLGTFLLDSLASLGDFFTEINKGFNSGGLTGFLSSIASGISNLLEATIGHIDGFGDALSAVGRFVVNVAKVIWNAVEPVFTWIRENVSVGDIFAGLAGGGIFVAAKKLTGFLDKIIDTIKGLFEKGNKGGGLAELKENLSDILGSLHDSLNSFSTGLKIGSLVSIAVAVGILSASLKTISDLDTGSIIKSLGAIGAMLGMLTWTMSSMTKSLEKHGSKGLVKAGGTLILISTAILVLANAMEKIGSLSLKDIGKGLIGIGGGLAELAVGLKIIGQTKISLSTSIAMIALAESCSLLGDAMLKFATLTWDELGRGLAGMGGALVEFVGAMVVLNKFSGFNSILGSTGLLIAVQSLQDMADGLKSFAEMSWDEIGRGLTAMGGALGELTVSLSALSKIAGFSSIFAAGSILIVTQGLDDIANALIKFGGMEWDEIGRGLTAMGGALLEVGIVTGGLGILAGFSGLFASGSIFITIQGLSDLADALQKFGDMTWDEIGKGLAGMGGALLEIGGITGALGTLTGFSGILGAGSILLAVQSLGDIADALQKFGSMTWDEIARGLVGMGGALTEVGVVAGLLGGLAGPLGLVGSGSLLIGVQGLGDLADALKKFGEMSWDEIGRGLTAMGAAMGETALGGLLNTLSGLGALSISEMAGSLGTLADSVSKWKDVTVPENLGMQLGMLANGVEKFTLAGIGAGALTEVSASLGILADSVNKWKDVTVPEDIGTNLKSLADGVEKFWLAGVGASALADAAPAIGTLADGVRKWKDVTVPDDLETNMTALANGVKAFSFAFAGGWSMSALVSPLEKLSDSVKKWVDVTVPEGLESQLKSLANGVKAFSFAFAGGWSMETVIGPLGELPGAIKKWNGVSIPEGLGSSLKGLADGIRPFSTLGNISFVAGGVESLVSSLKILAGTSLANASTDISGLADAISKLDIASNISESVIALGNSFTTGLVSPIKAASSSVITTLSGMVTSIRGYYTSFYNAGSYLVDGFTAGISENSFKATAQAVAMAEAALAAAEEVLGINSPSTEFKEVGEYSAEGYEVGIAESIDRVSETVGEFAKTMTDTLLETVELGNDELLAEQKQTDEESIKIEEAYWTRLLDIKKKGTDASKYQSMNMAKFEKSILDDTNEIWGDYLEKLTSNTDSIMGQRDLFAAVTQKAAVSKDTLVKNLQDQVNEYNNYALTLATLNARIADGGLKDAINEMGVDSLAELQAINSMTDAELTNYANLYDTKYALAMNAASSQLSGLQTETEEKLSSLYGGVDVNLQSFASTFDGTMQSIKKYVQMSTDQVKVAKDTGTQIVAGLAEGMSKSTAANSAAKNMIDSAEKAARAAAAINSPSRLFKKDGEYLTEGVAIGMTDRIPQVTESSNSVITGAELPFENSYADFMLIGQQLVEGFVAGISSSIEMAASAAASMAAAASSAARSALQINSPSKVFFGIGGYAGEGFVNALYNYAAISYNAASEMANSAKNGLQDAMSKTAESLNGNMDMQPTIRPILDLSDVTHGTRTLNGLFNSGQSIGVMANVGAISSVMSSRQNGGNDDVVSAINGLKNVIGKASGDTYSINGITYDDGSNITDAIKTIVNAARVERRM